MKIPLFVPSPDLLTHWFVIIIIIIIIIIIFYYYYYYYYYYNFFKKIFQKKKLTQFHNLLLYKLITYKLFVNDIYNIIGFLFYLGESLITVYCSFSTFL